MCALTRFVMFCHCCLFGLNVCFDTFCHVLSLLLIWLECLIGHVVTAVYLGLTVSVVMFCHCSLFGLNVCFVTFCHLFIWLDCLSGFVTAFVYLA